ncbi:MAG: phosphoribosylamine--glycine ligase [Deltaproteobacteria bacterium]|nr:phosphoribosylamine--glycine ligase [Deltaproteobacteria bacterium]
MKILVIGSGGREHAIVWKLKQSPKAGKIYCAPGNAGIAQMATCVDIAVDDLPALLAFATKEKINLVVVGPEKPLADGIVDTFKRSGVKIFGPTKEAALLESSKVYCKEFCRSYQIPTADFEIFTEADEALAYVRKASRPLVIKADGLASGKGVIVANDLATAEDAIRRILVDREFGAAGNKIIIEEKLVGEEVSFMAISDGNHVLPLASSQDHKAAYDGDQGPNTGGMGAYSPAPIVTNGLYDKIMERVMVPTIRGMVTEGRSFTGLLYAGLMICKGEPQVLEFNVRFGDPEAQPLLMRLSTDLVDVLWNAVTGNLEKVPLLWDARPAVCVVMASGGYPGDYEKGKSIKGIEEASDLPDVQVFHSGTKRAGDALVTDGGRVLGVTALGKDVAGAIEMAYAAVSKISWDGVQYRKDIGQKALRRTHA